MSVITTTTTAATIARTTTAMSVITSIKAKLGRHLDCDVIN